jgi:hypothetical protein
MPELETWERAIHQFVESHHREQLRGYPPNEWRFLAPLIGKSEEEVGSEVHRIYQEAESRYYRLLNGPRMLTRVDTLLGLHHARRQYSEVRGRPLTSAVAKRKMLPLYFTQYGIHWMKEKLHKKLREMEQRAPRDSEHARMREWIVEMKTRMRREKEAVRNQLQELRSYCYAHRRDCVDIRDYISPQLLSAVVRSDTEPYWSRYPEISNEIDVEKRVYLLSVEYLPQRVRSHRRRFTDAEVE